MVSLIQPGISKAQVQPCDVQARGVTGTKLDILGEQEIEFNLRSSNGDITFVHTFVVSPLKRCSSGILGMDFLQRVGAEFSLTAQVLYIDRYSFPLRGQEREVSEVQHLINAGQTGSLCPDQEEEGDESVGDWEGTVELAEAVTLPPLSGRIAQCRVVRRGDSMVDKVPLCNEAVSLDPEGLPGIYVARIVATLDVFDVESSLNAKRLKSFSGQQKSPLVDNIVLPPEELRKLKCVAGSDSSAAITVCDGGVLNVGSGECQPECLEGGSVPVATTSRRNDLQAHDSGSLPVENSYGNHVDTNKLNVAQGIKGKQGQVMRNKVNNVTSTINCKRVIQRDTQVLGYVPIQVVNLSLEEVELKKQTYIGVASPIQVIEGYDVNIIRQEPNATQGNFEECLNEKLTHLDKKDRNILEAMCTMI